jgi:hypothetical protein
LVAARNPGNVGIEDDRGSLLNAAIVGLRVVADVQFEGT